MEVYLCAFLWFQCWCGGIKWWQPDEFQALLQGAPLEAVGRLLDLAWQLRRQTPHPPAKRRGWVEKTWELGAGFVGKCCFWINGTYQNGWSVWQGSISWSTGLSQPTYPHPESPHNSTQRSWRLWPRWQLMSPMGQHCPKKSCRQLPCRRWLLANKTNYKIHPRLLKANWFSASHSAKPFVKSV